MFVYLFLIAAITASSELPITDAEGKELQELITILTTQDILETVTENTTDTTLVITEETVTVVAHIVQPIVITNAIDADMLKYKHWTGTYSPEIFTITINGTEVAQGAQHTLPAETKNLDVSFSYSFMNGMRTGTKTVSYQLNENSTQANITFSWKDDKKVLVDNGTFLKVTA